MSDGGDNHFALEARQVSYAYSDGLQALTGVDFRARPGEFVAIVGSNGSGKTTLMRVLMRLLSPQQGQVLLDGQDIRRLPAADLYRRVGMVFQNPSDQLFAPTVEQDVAFGPRNLDLPADEVTRRVHEALASVDALALAQRPIHHLSFGEQKRACLAGVLAMAPSILVLDEPTAGLDPVGEAHMIELLLRLCRRQKITILFCTHSVDLLPVLADRVCVLCKGRVGMEGTPHEIFSDLRATSEMGLRLPLIAQLFQELTQRDGAVLAQLPLTVEQARRQVLQWIGETTVRKTGGGQS